MRSRRRVGLMPTRWPMPTERDFESVAERQVREATERGEFDDLPGAGKPLADFESVYDPTWWAKRHIRRERVRDRADELRRAIRAELPRLRLASDRVAVEARVGELNELIQVANEHLGPDDRVHSITL